MTLRLIAFFGLACAGCKGKPSAVPPLAKSTDVRADSSTLAPPCLNLATDTVALAGTVVLDTFPGPPHYESVDKGDASEVGYYLRLDTPVCAQDDEGLGGGNSLTLMQLVPEKLLNVTLAPALDQHVVVKGTLFEAETGHHHTPVLITVLAYH